MSKKSPESPNPVQIAPAIASRPIRFLTRDELLARVPVTYPSIWAWMRDGTFPSSRVIGPSAGKGRRVMWIEAEIDDWLASRPKTVLKARKQPEDE